MTLTLLAALTVLSDAQVVAEAALISPGVETLDLPPLGSIAQALLPQGEHVFVVTGERLLLRLNASGMSMVASLLITDRDCETKFFSLTLLSDRRLRLWCTVVATDDNARVLLEQVIAFDDVGMREAGTRIHRVARFNASMAPAVVLEVARDPGRRRSFLLYVDAVNPCSSGVVEVDDADAVSSLPSSFPSSRPALQHFRLQSGSSYLAPGSITMCTDPARGSAGPIALLSSNSVYGGAMALDPLRQRLYIGGQQRVLVLRTDPLALLSEFAYTATQYTTNLVHFNQIALSSDSGMLWTARQQFSGVAAAMAFNYSDVATALALFVVRPTLTDGSQRPVAMAHCPAAGMLVFADTTELLVLDLSKTDGRIGAPKGPAITRLPFNTTAIPAEQLWPPIRPLMLRMNAECTVAYVLYYAKPNVIYAISTSTGAVLAVSRPSVGAALTSRGTVRLRQEISAATGQLVERRAVVGLSAAHPAAVYSPASGRLLAVSNGYYSSLIVADTDTDTGDGDGDGALRLPWPPALVQTAVSQGGAAAAFCSSPVHGDDACVWLAGNGVASVANISSVLSRRSGLASQHEFLYARSDATFLRAATVSRVLTDEQMPSVVHLLLAYPTNTAASVAVAQLLRWNASSQSALDTTDMPPQTMGLQWAATTLHARDGTLYAVFSDSGWRTGVVLLALNIRAPVGAVAPTIRCCSALDVQLDYLISFTAALDIGSSSSSSSIGSSSAAASMLDTRLLLGIFHVSSNWPANAAMFVLNASAIGGVPLLQLQRRAATVGVEASVLASSDAWLPVAAAVDLQLSASVQRDRKVAALFDRALGRSDRHGNGDTCEYADGVFPQGFAVDAAAGHVYVAIAGAYLDYACVLKLSRSSFAVLGTARLPLSSTGFSFGLVHGGMDEARRHMMLVAGGEHVAVMRAPIDPLQPVLFSAAPFADVQAGTSGSSGLLQPSAGWSCPLVAAAMNASCVFAGGAISLTGQLFGVVPSIGELTITLERVTGTDCNSLPFSGCSAASAAGGMSVTQPLRSLRRLPSQLLNVSRYTAEPATGSLLPLADGARDSSDTAATVAVPVWEVADHEGGECPDEPPASIACIPAAIVEAKLPGAANSSNSSSPVSTVTCLLAWPGASAYSRCLRATLYRLRASLRGQPLPMASLVNGSSTTALFTVIDGGPTIASVSPAIVSSHGQLLTLEIASPTTIDTALSAVALLPEAEADAAAAALTSLIAGGQAPMEATAAVLPSSTRCNGLTPAASTGSQPAAAGRMLYRCTAPPLRSSIVNAPLTAVFVGSGSPSSFAPLLWAASTFQSLNSSAVALGGNCSARAANATACSLQPVVSLLPLAVMYPSPVLSVVSPSSPITAGVGVTLTADAFATAEALTGEAATPQLRVWIDGAACTGVRYSGSSGRSIECIAPAGGGTSLPVVVEVSSPTFGAAFNVTSRGFAALLASSTKARFNSASLYSGPDGALLDAAVAASSLAGFGSDRFSYRAPTLRAVAQAPLQLLPSDCTASASATASTPARLLSVSVAVTDVPPMQQALLTVGSAECLSLACTSCSSGSECTCSCSVNASALCPAAGTVFRGAHQLPIALAAFPSTLTGVGTGRELSPILQQAPRSTRAFIGSAVTLFGAPVVTLLSPSRGAAGAVVEITGLALGSIAADVVAVLVGGTAAANVTWRSPTTLLFTAPPLDAHAAGGSAALVRVVTVGGTSSEAVTFTYPEVFTLGWGAAAASIAADFAASRQQFAASSSTGSVEVCAAAVVALPSTPFQRFPLRPAISIDAAFGRPLSCSLGLLSLDDAARWDEPAPTTRSQRMLQALRMTSSACTVALLDAADVRPVAVPASSNSTSQLYSTSFAAAAVTLTCDGLQAGALPPAALAFAITASCEDTGGGVSAALPPILAVISGLTAEWTAGSLVAVASSPLLPLQEDDRHLRAVLSVTPWPSAALAAAGSAAPAMVENASTSLALDLLLLDSMLACRARMRVAGAHGAGLTLHTGADGAALTLHTETAAVPQLLALDAGSCAANVSAASTRILIRKTSAGATSTFTVDGGAADAVRVALEFPWFAFANEGSGIGALLQVARQRAVVAAASAVQSTAPAARAAAAAHAFDPHTIVRAAVSGSCEWRSGGVAANVSLPAAPSDIAGTIGAVGSTTGAVLLNVSAAFSAAGSDNSSIPALLALPHVLWSSPPPPQVESQAMVSPAPAAALLLPHTLAPWATALATNATSCMLTAAVEQPVNKRPNPATAAIGGRLASSLVVPQTALASSASAVARVVLPLPDATAAVDLLRPAPSLTFDSVLIAGFRESAVAYTAQCSFGGIALEPLTSTAVISGCPIGSAPAGDGGWVCSVCSSGQWSRGGAMSCAGCPAAGASCAAGVLTLRPGFYLDGASTASGGSGTTGVNGSGGRRLPQTASTTVALAAAGAAVVALTSAGSLVAIDGDVHLVACINPAACTLNATAMASAGIVQYGCAPGYTGSLCGACDRRAGYILTDPIAAVCAQCNQPATSAFIIIAFVLLAVAAIAWLAIRKPPQATESTAVGTQAHSEAPTPQPRDTSSLPATGQGRSKQSQNGSDDFSAATSFRMVMTHVQTLNALTLLRSGSADVLRRVLAWSAVAAANPSAFPAVACAVPLTFASRLTLLLVLPLCLIAAAAAARCAMSRRRSTPRNRSSCADLGKSAACARLLSSRCISSCGRRKQLPGSAVARTTARRGAASAGPRQLEDDAHTTVSPLAMLSASSAAAAGSADPHARARRVTAAASAAPSPLASAPSNLASGAMPAPAAANATSTPLPLLWWLVNSALLLASLAYMPLVQASIAALDCLPDTVDGAHLLRADLSVSCGSPAHAPMAALAVAVLVLVGLGLPLLIIVLVLSVIMRQPERAAVSSHSHSAEKQTAYTQCRLHRLHACLRRCMPPPHVFASLYGDYDVARGRGWFEAAVLARKSALALAMQLLALPGEQALAASVVLLIALMCSVWARPYRRDRSNSLEIAQLAALLFSAVASLTYALPGAGSPAAESREAGAAACILLVNLAALAAVVVDGCVASKRAASPSRKGKASRLAAAHSAIVHLRSRIVPPRRLLTSGAAAAGTASEAVAACAAAAPAHRSAADGSVPSTSAAVSRRVAVVPPAQAAALVSAALELTALSVPAADTFESADSEPVERLNPLLAAAPTSPASETLGRNDAPTSSSSCAHLDRSLRVNVIAASRAHGHARAAFPAAPTDTPGTLALSKFVILS